MKDNIVIPFAVKPLGIRGRLVRLGAVMQDIVLRHNYPAAVNSLLAESTAMTALLGSSLKFNGKFIAQTKTSGPVSMIVADYLTYGANDGAPKGKLRSCAKFSTEQVGALGAQSQKQLLGDGYLAMTIDQGSDMDRYQGIVNLGDNTLTDAAHEYFAKSEQIPTRIKLAAGEVQQRGETTPHYRAGAILIQHLPSEGGISPVHFSSGDAPEGSEEQITEDDNWVKAKALMETVEDHELLDPSLSGEELLYRLYHEDGVTVYPEISLERYCACSREAVIMMFKNFSAEDKQDLVKDDKIEAACEFCSTNYVIKPEEIL